MGVHGEQNVTILILIDGFLQCYAQDAEMLYKVTILILIDGFLQSIDKEHCLVISHSHNPYFNRWFSAIR